ncbi:MAG: DUF3489 domain-containing protein, partial [Thermoguttaceae bacterium]
MKTIETETTTTLEAQAAPATEIQEPKAPTKAHTAQQARHVASAKPKSKNKAKAPRTAPKVSQKAAKKAHKADAARQGKPAKPQESAGPREGSKTAQVVAMLQRKNGASLEEIMEKMGWQKHYADIGIRPTPSAGSWPAR